MEIPDRCQDVGGIVPCSIPLMAQFSANDSNLVDKEDARMREPVTPFSEDAIGSDGLTAWV